MPDTAPSPAPFSVATWNVHGFVGRSGATDVETTAAVLAGLEVDAVGVQEVHAAPFGGPDACVRELERLTGLAVVPGFVRGTGAQAFGNLLLVRGEPRDVRRAELGRLRGEPRGVVSAVLPCGVRVATTHLGLSRPERRVQLAALGRWLAEQGGPAGVVCGDFNEWRPWNLAARFGFPVHVPSLGPTFPARWPVLPLDRIGWWGRLAVEFGGPVRGPATAAASDHLPVAAGFVPQERFERPR